MGSRCVCVSSPYNNKIETTQDVSEVFLAPFVVGHVKVVEVVEVMSWR